MIQTHDQIYLVLYGGQVEVEATVSVALGSACDTCVYGNHTAPDGVCVIISLVRLANQAGHPVARNTPLWKTAEAELQKLFRHNQCICPRHQEALEGDIQYALEALRS